MTDGIEENNKMRQGGDAGVRSTHGISEDFFMGSSAASPWKQWE